MPRSILVPLDGSPLAERAFAVAAGFAQSPDSQIVLLRAIPAHSEPAAGSKVSTSIYKEADDYLNAISERLGLTNAEAVVAEGEAASTILHEISRRPIDLVVMSTHGRSGLGRWIYGSVADAVMRRSPVPVVLVSAGSPARPWPADRPSRILLTLDYSTQAEAVLPPVEDLARALKAELVLLSVTPLTMAVDGYGQAYLAFDVNQDRADRQAYLERVATNLRAAGLPVKLRVEFGFPAETILNVAREEAADLIALSTHGSGGITRLLMGSVATAVVQRASIPVMIVRPVDAGTSDAESTTAAPVHGPK